MVSSRTLAVLVVAGAVTLAAFEVSGSDRRSGAIERVEYLPSTMVHVPAGAFMRGPTAGQRDRLVKACVEEAPHLAGYFCDREPMWLNTYTAEEIHVDAFQIDRYEVTVAEFRQCVAEGGCELTALVAGDERYLVSDWPMVNVSWQDAVDYCTHQAKRLPTEAEWEKAARGTSGALWPWGNQDRADGSNHGKTDDEAAIEQLRFQIIQQGGAGVVDGFIPDDSDGHEYAHAPGAMRWSESPYGAYDMAGNVAEWVADYFSQSGYDELPASNPLRDVPLVAGDDYRAIRGGSWAQPKFFGATFFRWYTRPNARDTDLGFRCARSIE